MNKGVIDHSGFSWIPANANPGQFVGVGWPTPAAIDSVVWHGQTGYNGRSAGTWVLQYTTDASPAAGSTWTDIGTYVYAEPTCASPMPRTCFAFTPVPNVTAVRLLVSSVSCSLQAAVQELEVYGPLNLTPSSVGDAPVAAAIAGRPNLALASAGGVAFSSSDLGPNYSAPDVNNGIIDHSGFSWIPATAAGGDLLVVTPNEEDADILAADLRFLSQTLPLTAKRPNAEDPSRPAPTNLHPTLNTLQSS